jgi:hypothetical protein
MNQSLSFRQKVPKKKVVPSKPIMTKFFSDCLEVQQYHHQEADNY